MSRSIAVHLLPSHCESVELSGSIAVMIDVLRASTTIIHALAAGASAVVPFAEVDEARQFASTQPEDSVVLGGERGGKAIPEFDLDNSPLRYTAETVGGKTVAMTTTNGTRALLRCRSADRVLIGAFVNQGALIDELIADDRPVHLVCAGTNGEVTAEDVLFAGSVVKILTWTVEGEFAITNDSAAIADDLYSYRCSNEDGVDANIAYVLRRSHGGRNLLRLGFEADIARAATRDRFTLVPEYDAESNRIT